MTIHGSYLHLLLASIMLLPACTVVDGDMETELARGWGELEIRGDAYLGRAELSTESLEDGTYVLVQINLTDGRKLMISHGTLDFGHYRIGNGGDEEMNVTFRESRRLWSADTGYVHIDHASAYEVSGSFKVVLYDPTSSCYRCEGTMLEVKGHFSALSR